MKYDLLHEKNESYEDFKNRCLSFLATIPTLSDNELLALPYNELVHLHSKNYARYLALKNPSFPQAFSHAKVGDTFSVPFYQIFPRSMCDENWPPSEWDFADVGGTRTQGPIEVKIVDGRKLIVHDGHNRLKDEVAKGNEEVLVKVMKLVERDVPVTREEAVMIMLDLNLPAEARQYAAEIVAIWDTPME